MNAEHNVNIRTNGGTVPARQSSPIHLIAKPVADVYERRDSYVLSIDLPGALKDQIEVIVEPGYLAVRAGVMNRNDEPSRWVHREIGWNRFEREFKLGPGVDEKRATAEFVDGVLTITLPKTEENKTRQIEIK